MPRSALTRRTALGLAGAAALTPALARAAQTDRRQVARRLAETVGRNYQDPTAAARLSAAILARLDAGAYAPAQADEAFAALLTADLRAVVADRHMAVAVNVPPAEQEPSLDPVFSLRQNYGVQSVRRLGGNVGLIELNFAPSLSFGDAVLDRYAAAMALVADTRALIVDVRAHMGGEPETIAYFASYLFDRPPFLINSIRYRTKPTAAFTTTAAPRGGRYGERRPVLVTTSPDTFSGGEELAYDLQATGRARIVGRPTGGGANPNEAFDLGQGFTAYVPNGAAVNPVTGGNWEGVGVKPDVEAEPDKALAVAQRLALQAALAQAGSASERQSIEQAISSLPA